MVKRYCHDVRVRASKQTGYVLTIEASATLLSDFDDGGGLTPALVILPGAMVMAVGAVDAPITFTSSAEPSELACAWALRLPHRDGQRSYRRRHERCKRSNW